MERGRYLRAGMADGSVEDVLDDEGVDLVWEASLRIRG